MAEQPPTAMPSTQEQNVSPAYGTAVWVSYKKDIRTRLRSSLRSVARFFRIMSPPTHDPFEEFKELKDEYSDIQAYYHFLSSLYKSAETFSLDHDRWKVTTLSTYKSTGLFEHECLVANLECEGEKVFLRFERIRSKLRAKKASSAGKTSKATPKTQASDDSDPSPDNITDPPEGTRPAGGSSSGSSSKTAQDAITFSQTLKALVKGSECIEVVRFSEGKGLTLSEITILARCVNKMGQDYSLFKANCYWFAHLMVETARLIEPTCKVELMSKKKPGEWKNFLPLTKSEPEVIQEVKEEFDNLYLAFNDNIENSINNVNSPIYLKKRAEAERLAAEKEEAERKHEEAEEEIKRLRAQLAAAQAANGAK